MESFAMASSFKSVLHHFEHFKHFANFILGAIKFIFILYVALTWFISEQNGNKTLYISPIIDNTTYTLN